MSRFCVSLLSALILIGCARTPDVERIRQTIVAMQHAVEAHELHGFMDHISADFTGNDGTVDHNGLANLLRLEVLRNDKVAVFLSPIDIDLQGDRAIVHLTATLTGGPGLLPEHGAIYVITSGWKRDGSQWRCFNATWNGPEG